MNPGETILGFDFANHLWIVISTPTPTGHVVVANLTSHDKRSCGVHCVVVTPVESPYLDHDSYVYYRGATLNPVHPLINAKADGSLRQHDSIPANVLQRIQQGALGSAFTNANVKAAVQASI